MNAPRPACLPLAMWTKIGMFALRDELQQLWPEHLEFMSSAALGYLAILRIAPVGITDGPEFGTWPAEYGNLPTPKFARGRPT